MSRLEGIIEECEDEPVLTPVPDQQQINQQTAERLDQIFNAIHDLARATPAAHDARPAEEPSLPTQQRVPPPDAGLPPAVGQAGNLNAGPSNQMVLIAGQRETRQSDPPTGAIPARAPAAREEATDLPPPIQTQQPIAPGSQLIRRMITIICNLRSGR